MNNQVFFAKCDDYSTAEIAVNRILDNFGGARQILGDAKTVLIKPNLVMPKAPDQFATTHPAVVQAVCKSFVKIGATVTIADTSGNPLTVGFLKNLYAKCGMDIAAKESGALLSYDTSHQSVKIDGGVMLKQVDIISAVANAQLVISVGKVKTHALGLYTGAVKNMFGTLPGIGKPLMHSKYPDRTDFFNMILDVYTASKASFSILDGVVGMEGDGPTGGTPKKLGAIIGGHNAHTVDYATCKLIGFHAERVPSILLAEKRGFLQAFNAETDIIGDNCDDIKTFFRPPNPHHSDGKTGIANMLGIGGKKRQKSAPFPIILENCVGCKDCVNVCPQKTIEIITNDASNIKKQAFINIENCIKCYCCHEFCPYKAIGFKNQ